MTTFFETNRQEIIYGATVIISVIVLNVLTTLLMKGLMTLKKKKFPYVNTTPIFLIKRVLRTLWIVLGLIALSFLFVEEGKYGALKHHFKVALYLGFMAVLTIVSATSVNLWFRKNIKEKILTQEDPTALKFLRYVAVATIYFVGTLIGLMAFPSLRGIAQTALGGAGVLALIVGVSSQEALSNLVSGIFIISFKPFKIGDVVKVTDTMIGTVTDITFRHTILRNFENKMIVIPNSIINKEKLINYNLGELKCCEHIEIGISYDSNVELAKKIIQEECENHILILDNRTELEKKDNLPIVRTALTKLNDSSVTIRAWAWVRDFGDAFNLKCDVYESVKLRFESNGIEIPYPYQTIVMKEAQEVNK